MFRRSVLALSALALLVSAGGSADAKRKKKDKGPQAACGLSYLPFIEGHTWKYLFAIPPGVEDSAVAIKAKTPELFTVVVKSIKSEGDSTTITLEESYRKVSRQTVLSCDDKGLKVPLESFFFAGELPGAIGMKTDKLVVKGDVYPGKSGLKTGESMYVELKGPIAREAGGDAKVNHPVAQLEIERQITVGKRAEVEVEHGIHTSYGVQVELAGRTRLDSTPETPVPLPEGNALLWFAPGIGLVRAYNRLNQGWELSEHLDASGTAIAY